MAMLVPEQWYPDLQRFTIVIYLGENISHTFIIIIILDQIGKKNYIFKARIFQWKYKAMLRNPLIQSKAPQKKKKANKHLYFLNNLKYSIAHFSKTIKYWI